MQIHNQLLTLVLFLNYRLPHTDEAFWNRDLGNCTLFTTVLIQPSMKALLMLTVLSFALFLGLDYTNNFSGNKSPDDFLYNFLTDLYGSVDGSIAPNVTTADNGDGSTASQSPGERRQLRQSTSRKNRSTELFSSVTDVSRRRELLRRWEEINAAVVNGFKASDREGWRLLHQTEYGEAHEIELDEEYTVQVHALLA